MDNSIDDPLKKVVKGTAIIFSGIFIGKFLALTSKWIIINGTEPHEFGLISIALAILSITLRVSALGLPTSVARNIPLYLEKNDLKRVWGVITSSIHLVAISGVMCSLLLFFLSDQISQVFTYNEPELTPDLSAMLKILAIAVPFCIITNILISILRGFENVRVKVYFEDTLPQLIRTGLFSIVFILGIGLFGFVFSYLVSYLLIATLLIVYAARELSGLIKEREGIPMKAEMLKFSLPLLGVGIMGVVMNWADTLMLGYFREKELAGLYNAAVPLVQLLSVFLGAMVFIYLPIATSFYSKKMYGEMKKIYAILTKWTFSLTIPFILVLLFFPGDTLRFLFGESYASSHAIAEALQILVIGFGISNLLGPNGHTLIVFGKTKWVMVNNTTAAIVNLILNFILIPPYGLMGAAIATASSLVLLNLLSSLEVYHISGIHPFTKNYLKPILVSIPLIFVISTIFRELGLLRWWMLPLIFAVFVVIHAISILLTKSFDQEDIMILKAIEKRSGMNLAPVKKILKRFM